MGNNVFGDGEGPENKGVSDTGESVDNVVCVDFLNEGGKSPEVEEVRNEVRGDIEYCVPIKDFVDSALHFQAMSYLNGKNYKIAQVFFEEMSDRRILLSDFYLNGISIVVEEGEENFLNERYRELLDKSVKDLFVFFEYAKKDLVSKNELFEALHFLSSLLEVGERLGFYEEGSQCSSVFEDMSNLERMNSSPQFGDYLEKLQNSLASMN